MMIQLSKLFMKQPSLSAEIDRFIHSNRLKTEATRKFYGTGLRSYLDYTNDAWPPTPDTILDWLNDCKRRGLAKGTVHAYYRTVRTFCNWAEEQGVLTDNPIPKMRRSAPKPPIRKIPKSPKRKEVQILIKFFEFRVEAAIELDRLKENWRLVRDFAIVSLMIETGMRVGEIERLNIPDIDFDTGKIYIWEAKNDEQRIVAFGDETKADLKFWLGIRNKLNIPASLQSFFVGYNNREGWAILSRFGIENVVTQRCIEAGIKTYTPHDFRHYFATQKLANGAGLNEVQRLMGHANATTTNIYTQMHIDEAVERHPDTSPRDRIERTEWSFGD